MWRVANGLDSAELTYYSPLIFQTTASPPGLINSVNTSLPNAFSNKLKFLKQCRQLTDSKNEKISNDGNGQMKSIVC